MKNRSVQADVPSTAGAAWANKKQSIQVVRRANLTHDEFVRGYLSPLHPVILTDAITHWAALTKWTPAFFKEHYGTLSITIDDQSYTMRDFVNLVLKSDSDHPAPYLRNQ